jgi:hypothetical protein
MSSTRPQFVGELLSRPLLPIIPNKLGNSQNPPYSPALRALIADAGVHPLLESALHLLNDDLFSAHFLLRKMQEDQWAKWLHGVLHAREGDILNAKCWYRDADADMLKLVYHPGSRAFGDEDDPHVLASHALDRLSLAIGHDPAKVRAHTEQAELGKDKAYSLETLQAFARDDKLETNAREALWLEMTTLLDTLDARLGWAPVDGTTAYTKDSAQMKEQGRVLGEGWRSF